MQRRLEEVWHILCPSCRKALTDSAKELVKTRAEDGPVLLLFPTIGAGGSEWRLRRAQVEEWQELFPSVDVLNECRSALAWIRASPERRKTVKGMPRFLVAWFTRSVDRRRSNGQGSHKAAANEGHLNDWLARRQS